jgi:chromosomal replication initiator protein
MEKQMWQLALDKLKGEFRGGVYEWLRQGRLIATNSPDKYILQVMSPGIKDVLENRCRIPIERALTDVIGSKQKVHVSFTVKEKKQPSRGASLETGDRLFPDAAEEAASDFAETQSPSLAEALAPRGKRRAAPEERRRDRQLRQMNGAVNDTRRPQANGNGALSYPAENRQAKPATMRPTNEQRQQENGAVAETPTWLNSKYTFDTFIVGSGNHFAYAASNAVAEKPADSYNPLFLYGGVGLGKTHLLHAIAHVIADKGLRALYVTSETFTNEIINAIRYRTTEEFRTKYRSVDVLLVDDIQFIAGKDSTEEEFFHTFNALHGNHRQIVMCSDRPPKEIDLEERLRSRFEWGLIVDIQPPDLETRLAILRTKAEALNLDIPNAVLDYLGERIQTNVRELEGMLNRVVAFADLQHTPLTPDIARQALSNLTPAERPHRIVRPGEILAAVSSYYQVSLEDLRGKQRDKRIVVPRQVAMWLMRSDTEMSLMEAGHELGGRDHSTVIHGCEKIDKELEREGSPIAQDIAKIRQQIAQ